MGKDAKNTGVRLYAKGSILGFKRGRRNTYNHTTLCAINDVTDKESTEYYLGKKIAYIYRAKVEKAGSHFRCIWGKVIRRHGSNGVVRCKWARNIPAEAIGSSVRVMMYPSRV